MYSVVLFQPTEDTENIDILPTAGQFGVQCTVKSLL